MSSEAKKPLPDLKGTTLDVHWADFKKLLERREAARPKTPETDQPPVPFTLGPATVEGEVFVAGPAPAALLKASFDLTVLADGWVAVPLLDGNVGLTSAKIDGEDLALNPEETSPLTALVKGPGSHRITLEFTSALISDAEQSAFELSLPAAPVVELSIRIPRTRIEAEVTPSVSTTVAEEGGSTRVRSSLPAGQSGRISWTRTRVVEKAAPVEPAQLFAKTETFVGLGDGMAKALATVSYNILKSPVRSLTIEVPDDATVADVTGPQVAAWEARAASGGTHQQVVIDLRSEFKGATVVGIELDRPWDEKPPIKLPLTKALGVERESGFVAVAAMTALEVTPGEAKGHVRVDVKELPAALARRMPHPVVLAWKFREAGGEISVNVQRHADLPVVTGMADTAVHTVLQTQDGKRVSRSTYSIRNSQRQFVRISLPKGATVWSTLLDGSAVKPASGDAGVVLIPLKKAQSFQDTETPFEVEVVTMTEAGALAEKGKLEIPLPSCDLPIGALRFSLWVPEGYLYDDFGGSLEEVRGFRDPWSPEGTVSQAMQHITPPKAPAPAPPPPPRPTAPAAPAAAAAPMGAPMQAPAAERSRSAGASKLARRSATADMADAKEEMQASMDDQLFGEASIAPPELAEMPYQPPTDIGVLPVKMAVPEKGLCFAFEKILVLDEALFVSTEYAREKIAR